MNPIRISASLVLFKPDLATVERTLRALQEAGRLAGTHYSLQLGLTFVDNSADDAEYSRIASWLEGVQAAIPDWTLQLQRSEGNVGYGRGNNLVIANARSDYHLVVNPDLFVNVTALLEALRFMEEHRDVGLLTPAVFGEEGERHYLCKRNPTLFVMFLRSFAPVWLQKKLEFLIHEFEMRDCDYEKPIHPVEYPTGCFMFFRTAPLQKIGGFDPDFFLHYEDADIGRRMLRVARIVYVPAVRVVHQWARDTHRSLGAKLGTVKSGWLYWRKWGGFFRNKPSAELKPPAAIGQPELAPAGQRILVTGANGFIGQALCTALSSQGYSVRGVVRKKKANGQPGVSEHWVLDEVDEHTDWAAALSGVDSVVHLAARVHQMRDTAADPMAEFRRVNVALALNLARQAAKAGVRRFVFMSSVKVNGETTVVGQPFTADDEPKPMDPYGVSKFEAEQALIQLAAETGLELVIVRPVLVYGPGVKANFHEMMRWVFKGVPLPLGALDNRRSFVAIDNVVDLISVCLHHPQAANQVFLVSDGEDLTVSDLLRRTAAALARPARLLPVPIFVLRMGGRLLGKELVVQRLCDTLQVDIEKTQRLLGWNPPLSVDAALKKTAQQLRDE
ncbi:Nucleoside-diphosphate-sugar epimerase [Polaromonas sp. YR568]|uniref:NAD-dependent epimerase/dehydratase family protein n=1 Tax=Polaromonas sp. YR568 TaxID=1855301 RepID=UPI0008E4233C|nr:Nucleoside-diphosphate-sugar epimerase [Polaromonas sp. YR568]